MLESTVEWRDMADSPSDRAPSDRELWRALQKGQQDAFEQLFRRHSDAIYNYAFRRTSAWALAEDVTQATFTALWRRARQGRVDGARGESVRPILYAMARNECSNALRGTRRHRELVTRVGAQPSPETTDNVSEWVRAEQTMAEIRAGLDSLPPRQRDVVELVSWAGLTEAEAADVLDVPGRHGEVAAGPCSPQPGRFAGRVGNR